jgi:glycine cleavage system aminomethyltransferase T
LQVAGDETLQSSQEVRFDGQRIGEVLFGFRALTLGRNMAWAFVGTRNAEFGRKVTVVTESAEKDAVVVDPRCYDPSGERMKA